MRCTCKTGNCDYHNWKDAQATRALARRHRRNVERHIRRKLLHAK